MVSAEGEVGCAVHGRGVATLFARRFARVAHKTFLTLPLTLMMSSNFGVVGSGKGRGGDAAA